MSEDAERLPPAKNAVAFVLAARTALERGNCSRSTPYPSCSQVFCLYPTVTYMVWIYIMSSVPVDFMPKHILWVLLLMKVYSTEAVNESLGGVHYGIFRWWAGLMTEAVSDLHMLWREEKYNYERTNNQTNTNNFFCRFLWMCELLTNPNLALNMFTGPQIGLIVRYTNPSHFHHNGIRIN